MDSVSRVPPSPPHPPSTIFPVELTSYPPTTSSSSSTAAEQPPSPVAQQPKFPRHRLDGASSPTSNNFIVIPPLMDDDHQQQAQQRVVHHRREQRPQHQTVAQQPPKRCSAQSGKSGDDEGLVVALQQRLFEHYHLVAYSIVIVTYSLAFGEYLYLRLLSLIYTDPVLYRRHCDKRHEALILRNELHFASGCAVFLVMSVYQLVCFFLLTVSSKYMEIKRTYAHVISIEQRLRHELVFTVKRTMFATLYPTFGIYLMCSIVILCAIFYMIGLRDPILHTGSRVLIYVFDLFVVLYFLAFPVLCVLFHPDIDCRARLARLCCAPKREVRAVNSAASKSLQTTPEAAPTPVEETVRSGAVERGSSRVTKDGSGQTAPPPQLSGTVRSAPGAMETVVVEHHPPLSPTLQSANYGSLERWPGGQIVAGNGEEAEDKGRKTGESVRRMVERQRRRRQDRYRRLKGGGSDESEECRGAEADENGIRKSAAAMKETEAEEGQSGRAADERAEEEEANCKDEELDGSVVI